MSSSPPPLCPKAGAAVARAAAPAAPPARSPLRVSARSVIAGLRSWMDRTTLSGGAHRVKSGYAVATDAAASSRVSGVLPQRVVWAYSISRGK